MRDTNLITLSGAVVLVRDSFIVEQQYLAEEIYFYSIPEYPHNSSVPIH
jgi:hypothetical protein